MNAAAILGAIRGVLRGELGSVRTVPADTYVDGIAASIDADGARRLRSLSRRGFDVEVPPPVRTGALGPPTASRSILALTARVTLVLPIAIVAETASADHRHTVRAEAMEAARVIADALEWPGNLARDGEGTPTGLVSQRLQEAASPRIAREDWAAGLLVVELSFRGHAMRSAAVPDAPALVSAPAIAVSGGGDPLVGSTLLAAEGVWTGADSVAGQWLRDGVAIDGETSPAYVTVEADDGTSITYRSTAIGGGGTSTSTSNALVVGAAAVVPLPYDFPLAPDVGPRHWWIGDEGISLAGVEVDTWSAVTLEDSTLRGMSISARATDARATRIAASATLNGEPAVGFDLIASANGRRLDGGGTSAFEHVYHPIAGMTLFVAWTKSGAGQQAIVDCNTLNTSLRGFHLLHGTSGAQNLIVRIGNGSSNVFNVTTANGTCANGAHYVVVRLRQSGSPQYDVRLDGVSRASGAMVNATAGGSAAQPLAMGNRGGPSSLSTNPLEGEVSTFGTFDRYLTDAEVADLETWLARYKP